MFDHPWARLLIGALAAALLGAMAARIAVSAGSAGADGGALTAGGRADGSGSSGSGGGPSRTDGSGAGSEGSDPGAGGPGAEGSSGATATLAGGSGRVTVHVTGEVRRPGVYALPEGSRVDDAVRRAGGARGTGDRQALNLAATVRDGQQVRVPPRAPVPSGGGTGAAAGGAASAAGPVDLNTASVEELQTLDGVGEATAAKIVELREQRGGIGGVDDLDEIPGIGAKKLEALRAQLEP